MVHSSCCSARMAPTRRITEASSGKICTTFERRLTSLLSRSSGLFDHTLRQCSWERGEGEHVGLGCGHELGDPRELFGEEFCGVVPGGGDGGRVGVHELHPERGGDHVLMPFGDTLEEVAGEVHPTPLPRRAGEVLADRCFQAFVGVGDGEAHAGEAAAS